MQILLYESFSYGPIRLKPKFISPKSSGIWVSIHFCDGWVFKSDYITQKGFPMGLSSWPCVAISNTWGPDKLSQYIFGYLTKYTIGHIAEISVKEIGQVSSSDTYSVLCFPSMMRKERKNVPIQSKCLAI